MAGLGQHQVDRGVAAMRAAAAELVDISLLGLDAGASGAALIALVQLESQVAELKHRVRILDTVAPEIGEAHEAKKLADEEADAEKAASLIMAPDGAGKVRGRFVLPEMHAAMFRKMLLAFVIQHHDPQPEPKPTGDEDEESELQPRRRATSHELGLAFCELIERLDHTAAPKAGGTGATVVVTMSLAATATTYESSPTAGSSSSSGRDSRSSCAPAPPRSRDRARSHVTPPTMTRPECLRRARCVTCTPVDRSHSSARPDRDHSPCGSRTRGIPPRPNALFCR